MPRKSSGLLTGCGLFFLGVLAIFLFVLFDLLQVSKERITQLPDETVEESYEIIPPDSEFEPIRPLLELPINGKVVDGRMTGIVGLEIICGSEIAFTDATGRFHFPPAVRQEFLPVSLRRGGEEVARWEIKGGQSCRRGLDDEHPRPPSRFRWSITLCEENKPVVDSGAGGKGTEDEAPDQQPGSSLESGGAIERYISLETVFVEEWGSTGKVHFGGQSLLPEGAELTAALLFRDPVDIIEGRPGDRMVASVEPALVAGGLFQSTIPLPDDFQFFSAQYEFHVYFNTSFSDFEAVQKWQREKPDIPWKSIEDADLMRPVFIGFEDEEIVESKQSEEYYKNQLAVAVSLRKLLDSQFFTTIKLGNGWDPQLLTMRLESSGSWTPSGPVNALGEFREKDWRTFMDEAWRPRVRELLDRHEARARYRYKKAALRMRQLLISMLQISQMESIMIYEHFGLSAHPHDRYQDEYQPRGDASLLKRMIDGDIAELGRYAGLADARPTK